MMLFCIFVLQGVEKICKKYDISFMMDEVQTGGGSTGSAFLCQNDAIDLTQKFYGVIFHFR